jgi:type II secretory pathway pseudopilin PulG
LLFPGPRSAPRWARKLRDDKQEPTNIIGILAAIAVPNFIKFQCRSKQSEAKGNLKALYGSQESTRAESDAYVAITEIPDDLVGTNAAARATSTSPIGWIPKGQKIRYTYNSTGGATQFTASWRGW